MKLLRSEKLQEIENKLNQNVTKAEDYVYVEKDYDAKWTAEQKKRKTKEDVVFKVPAGYSDHLDHFTNFFDAIRTGKQVVEDAEFGFRAAAPALACNESYLKKKIIHWDPINLKLK